MTNPGKKEYIKIFDNPIPCSSITRDKIRQAAYIDLVHRLLKVSVKKNTLLPIGRMIWAEVRE